MQDIYYLLKKNESFIYHFRDFIFEILSPRLFKLIIGFERSKNVFIELINFSLNKQKWDNQHDFFSRFFRCRGQTFNYIVLHSNRAAIRHNSKWYRGTSPRMSLDSNPPVQSKYIVYFEIVLFFLAFSFTAKRSESATGR